MNTRLETRRLSFETSWSPAGVAQMLRANVEVPATTGPRLDGEVEPSGFRLQLWRTPGALPGPLVEGTLWRTLSGGCRVEVAVHESGGLVFALAFVASMLLVTGAFALSGLALFAVSPSLVSAYVLAASLTPAGLFGVPFYRQGRETYGQFLSDVRLVDRFFQERLPIASGGPTGPFRSPGRV